MGQDSGFDAEDPELETLKGELRRVRFSSADGTFSVCDFVVPSRVMPITMVGDVMSAQPGESVEVTGRWIDDARFGRQLKIVRIQAIPPITEEGIERYLKGGFIEGIGPTLAKRIVSAFGAATLDILDESPQRLAEVEGIGKVRSEKIIEAWIKQRTIRRVMVFLQSHGVSSTYAIKIYKLYGDRAVEIILNNPYKLAEDIFGIGFHKADEIARRAGLEVDSHERLCAGVMHALKVASHDGHMFLPLDELKGKAAELLKCDPELLGSAIEALRMEQKLVLEPVAQLESPAVYLWRAYRAEIDAARHLRRLIDSPPLFGRLEVNAASLDALEAELNMQLAPAQRDGVVAAWAEKVMVLTGGPGTGKTTIVKAVVSFGERAGKRIALAAPTGRAAKRLTESTGRPAQTLHRLLEFSFQQGGFQYNEERQLDVEMLIVDESSMIDSYLLLGIVRALPDHARLLFVGDVDQLPSVGPGAVLDELIGAGVLKVVRLTEIFRQAQTSSIVLNAHRVNAGELPIVPERAPGQLVDFYMIQTDEPEVSQQRILELVCERIPKAFGYDPIQDVQILSPMHKGQVGCAALNALLQDKLNPRAEVLVRGQHRFKVGDKVMQLRNNYDKDVFNGDIGVVVGLDQEAQQLFVRMDDREVGYEVHELDELGLAYAITVHKSQGSEYPVVILPMMTQHYMMLQRNLFYTALTRAKRLFILVGTAKAVGIAVKQDEARLRYTQLAQRLGSGQQRVVALVGRPAFNWGAFDLSGGGAQDEDDDGVPW